MAENKRPDGSDVQGEGDYRSARKYQRDTEAYIQKKGAQIPARAKEAEQAIEGPEGAALERAEEKGKSKARH